MEQIDALRAEIAGLEGRVAHLAEQAKVCERGRLITKTRTKDGETTEEPVNVVVHFDGPEE